MRREFRVGNLYINRGITGALVDRQPFGGFKMTGVGSKAGGPDYLLQFLVPRMITENTLRRGFAPRTISSTDRRGKVGERSADARSKRRTPHLLPASPQRARPAAGARPRRRKP